MKWSSPTQGRNTNGIIIIIIIIIIIVINILYKVDEAWWFIYNMTFVVVE